MEAVQAVPMNNRMGGFSFMQKMAKKVDDQTWVIPVTAQLIKEDEDESATSTHRIELTVQPFKRNSASASRKRRHEPSDTDETTMGSQH